MAYSGGLGSLSILNEDLLRLILLDEALRGSLHQLACSSRQLLRQVLDSGRVKELTLRGGVKLAAMWGEWLQQSSSLHLRLDTAEGEDDAATLGLLLPGPNKGISALTVNLDVSDVHGGRGLCHGTAVTQPFGLNCA